MSSNDCPRSLRTVRNRQRQNHHLSVRCQGVFEDTLFGAVPNAAGESEEGFTRVMRGLRFSEPGTKIALGILIPGNSYPHSVIGPAGWSTS